MSKFQVHAGAISFKGLSNNIWGGGYHIPQYNRPWYKHTLLLVVGLVSSQHCSTWYTGSLY